MLFLWWRCGAQIKSAMGFALDHSEQAPDVVGVLHQSLTLKETPAPVKVARLYLVSDILHNSSSSVANASSYRTHLEVCGNALTHGIARVVALPLKLSNLSKARKPSSSLTHSAALWRCGVHAQSALPDMFESLNDTLRSITSRLTADTMKQKVCTAAAFKVASPHKVHARLFVPAVHTQVMSVLQWWDRVSLFPPAYLSGLEATFLRTKSHKASDAIGVWVTSMHALVAPQARLTVRYADTGRGRVGA